MANKESHGKLFINIASLIAVSMIAFSTLEAFFIVRNSKTKVQDLNVDRFAEVSKGYTNSITKTLDEYMAHLDFYTNADVVATKDTDQIVAWLRANENKRTSSFDYVAWVDKKGDFYSDIGTKTNVLDRDYYQAIMQQGKDFYIDNPVTSKTSGKTIIHICRAAKVNGETVGFFCAVIGIQHLSSLLDDVDLENNGLAILFSGNGKVIGKVGASDMMDLNLVSDGSNQQNDGMRDKIESDTSKGGQGIFWSDLQGAGKVLNIYAPVEYTQWALVIIIKQSAIVKAATEISDFVILFSILLMVLVVGTTALTVYKSIAPLSNVETTIADIATGNADLTKRINVKSHGEIARTVDGFNQFAEKLQYIMSSIKDTKDELVKAGDTLTNSTQETATAIQEIIENIEGMGGNINAQSDSVTETAGAVNQIASNIESLNKMIETQAAATVQASSSVEEMIGNINSVSNSVEKMAQQFKELQAKAITGLQNQDDVTQKIQTIEEESKSLQEANKVIADIAEQTNLLAMNAAIEAAHAGEAGKGFSVVADEIRKLSENSSNQSSSIGNQLNNIAESISQMVLATEVARQSFSDVSAGIENTNNLVQEITNSMAEQSEGSRQISQALNAMNDSTTEVKTSSFEMSEGNKQILEEITKLQDATFNMRTGMEKMSESAKKINKNGNDLSTISEKMENSISRIGAQVDQFQV